ncbi:hypothetical protein C0Q70_21273 [Pomacea canaliculata]|uniref:Uncharacterized protein n=1 Tax=Pomacea canaliculata TaxID=400727 RepID=A0A2T7NC59_POMCA|nr:hypothetical protein C0Q70_21273 [Pomacea canaliculata]
MLKYLTKLNLSILRLVNKKLAAIYTPCTPSRQLCINSSSQPKFPGKDVIKVLSFKGQAGCK